MIQFILFNEKKKRRERHSTCATHMENSFFLELILGMKNHDNSFWIGETQLFEKILLREVIIKLSQISKVLQF